MKLLHRHKWTYLAKEHHKVTERKTYTHTMMIGGSVKEIIKNVTTVRFFCKGCSSFKSDTVDGSVRVVELMKTGLLGDGDVE